MKENLEVLNLVLTEMGVPNTIRTVSDRLLIQKSIFLAQTIGGAPLGYAYSWYVRGPYAPSLTRDYYALQSALTAIDNNLDEPNQSPRTLRNDVRESLQIVSKLLVPPSDVSLTRHAWAELIASTAYLIGVEHQSEEGVKGRIRETKPWLSDYTSKALEALPACH